MFYPSFLPSCMPKSHIVKYCFVLPSYLPPYYKFIHPSFLPYFLLSLCTCSPFLLPSFLIFFIYSWKKLTILSNIVKCCQLLLRLAGCPVSLEVEWKQGPTKTKWGLRKAVEEREVGHYETEEKYEWMCGRKLRADKWFVSRRKRRRRRRHRGEKRGREREDGKVWGGEEEAREEG